MKTWHLKIFGQVQGVFFRSNLKQKAEQLGLKGWAKNEPDGTVLVEAQGAEESLLKLENWCYNGVEGARVTKVKNEQKEIKEKFKGFIIKYD